MPTESVSSSIIHVQIPEIFSFYLHVHEKSQPQDSSLVILKVLLG